MNRRPRAPLSALLAGVLLLAACSNDAPAAPAARETVAPAQTAAAATQAAAPRDASAAAPTAAGVRARLSAREQNAEPDADLAYEHIQELTVAIGPRVAGTPEEKRAADYLTDKLRSFGYTVEQQTFPVESFLVRSVSLQIEGATARAITVQPLTNSQGGRASGEVVNAGVGRPGDFPANMRGKIALVQRGEITFREKALNAANAGASALIVFNTRDELEVGTLQQNPPPIPALTISGLDGQRLRAEAAAGGVSARLAFDGGVTASESRNVIARPGGQPCRVVVGGHYDSVANAPGASDNASGTAAMVEVARVTALKGNQASACFVAFGAEEIGLVGSKEFLQRIPADERRGIRLMINLDMVSVGDEWWVIGTPDLQDASKAIAATIGSAVKPSRLSGASSDHASFIDLGIPALMLHRWNDPLLHTPEDAINRISKDNLHEALRLTLGFIAFLKAS